MRTIFNWIFYSNLYIGICAVAFTLRGQYLLDYPFDILSICFVFFSSIFTYLLIRIAAFKRIQEYPKNGRWNFFLRHISVMRKLLVLTGIGAIIFYFYLSRSSAQALLIPGAISLIYGLPLRFGKDQIRLRDIGIMKIFLIAFVWAFVGTALPLSQFGGDLYSGKCLLLFTADFLFILGITLPFDIKDIEIDQQHRVRTIPVIIGRSQSIQLALFLLFISGVIYANVFRIWPLFERPDYTVPMMISLVISGMTIYLSTRMKNDYFYFGLLDGMLILQCVLVVGYR